MLIREELEKRKRYFHDAKKEIASNNLRLLLPANVVTVALLSFFLLITPYIINGWQATVWHIGFLPASVFCCAITFFYELRGKNRGNFRDVTGLCILLEIILFGFSTLIDTAGTPQGSSVFVPLLYVVMPVLFTLPFYISYSVIGAAEIVYIVEILTFKDERIGQYDIFGSMFALLCSVVVANMILVLRVRDYEIRIKYKQLSTKDSLTDILNKQSSQEAFSLYFQLHNPHVTCMMMIVDLDNFKEVNDTKGHAAGDQVLRRTGQILLDTFQSTDIVGRFGGDEFVVLIKGIASEKLIRAKCEKIQGRLSHETMRDVGCKVTSSMGVVLAHRQNVEYSRLFEQADKALYEAKQQGKAGYRIREYDLSE